MMYGSSCNNEHLEYSSAANIIIRSPSTYDYSRHDVRLILLYFRWTFRSSVLGFPEDEAIHVRPVGDFHHRTVHRHLDYLKRIVLSPSVVVEPDLACEALYLHLENKRSSGLVFQRGFPT